MLGSLNSNPVDRAKVRLKRIRLADKAMEFMVYVSGGALLLSIVAIGYFLTHESRFAFDQKFTYGFLFAVQPTDMDRKLPEYADISYDIGATALTVHNEGAEGVDEKEEVAPMPTLEQLGGVSPVGTGTVIGGNLTEARPDLLYKDDWREPVKASRPHRFLLFAFATPEYKRESMSLAWDVQQGSNPSLVPYDLQLRMIQAPKGASLNPIEIDLKAQPKGRLELPTFIAESDGDRTKGYVFELQAKPTAPGWLATIVNFFRTDWGPTLAHPRYGFVPLLLSTLSITLIALLFAAPIGIASAVYLAEIASVRVREVLKPVIELLASIPTIVLGYFGLMLLAPAIQNTIAKAAGLDSGRSLLTAAIMMGVLLIPTVMTIAEDGLRAVPGNLRDGAFAIGLTHWESLRKVVLPAAKPALIAAVMLGLARAIGETMIVWVLSGGTPNMPTFGDPKTLASNLAKPARGIPDTIGIEMGNVTFEEPHYGHLFLLGAVLFAITFCINLMAFRLARRQAWRH